MVGRAVMGNVEKGDIEVDGWCVMGMRVSQGLACSIHSLLVL